MPRGRPANIGTQTIVDGITFPTITAACIHRGISRQLFTTRKRRGDSDERAFRPAGEPTQQKKIRTPAKPFLRMLS